MKDIFAEFYCACRKVEMSMRTSHVACRMPSIITKIPYLLPIPNQPNNHKLVPPNLPPSYHTNLPANQLL